MYVYTFIFFTVYRRKNTNALITCEPIIRLIRMNGWKILLPRSKVSYNKWRDLGMYGLRGNGWEEGEGEERETILYREYRETEWRKDREAEREDDSGILRKRYIYLMCNFYGMQKSFEFDGPMNFYSLPLSLSHTHTHTHTHTHNTQYAAAKEEEQRKLALSKIRRFKLRLRRLYNHAFTQVHTQYGRTQIRTRARTHTQTLH